MEDFEVVVGGGLTFRGRSTGPPDGRLVLLLHGFPQTSRSWEPTMEKLGGAGHRAVAFDQRGYSPGARPEGVEHYGIDSLVADVLAVADDLGGHRFDLVGHDWGGIIAWHVAGRYPARVRTLSVVSTPHAAAFGAALRGELGGDQPSRSGYVDLFRQAGTAEDLFLADDAAVLRRMYASFAAPDAADEYVEVLTQPGALTAAFNYYRATPLGEQPETGAVTSPTLYVWSTDDAALGREAAEATGQHVAGPYRFEVLEGVSHWIPEAAPDDLGRFVLEHLAAHD